MRLHGSATQTLARWVPPDPDQAVLRRRFLDTLAAYDDATCRSCRPGHLTASALIVSADRACVLLTLHAKAGRWFQVGGHCEPGDASLADAALREASEESGIDRLLLDPMPVQLDAHRVDFCGAPGMVHHLDVRFVALAPAGAVPVRSEESTKVQWWPAEELPDPALSELVRAGLSRAQSPSSWWPGGGSRLDAADQPSK